MITPETYGMPESKPHRVVPATMTLSPITSWRGENQIVIATERPDPISDHAIMRLTTITPVFDTQTIKAHPINPVFDTSSILLYSISGFASDKPSYVAHVISSKFDSELYVANNDNMGGYATEAEALAAAEEYNFGVPVMAYEQPEGTFSFVFKQPTELFCQIKGTNIYATKWLIGGG
jgi:hypothetical protein